MPYFLEKPLSDSLEGVDELVRIAAEYDKKVMVGFCFRYHEGLLKAKKLVQSGRIGRLVSVRALMGEHFPEVSPGLRKALEFLQKTDLEKIEPGRVEIDGDNVYALVQKYETKPAEQGLWEAHKKYIDVQYIYSGYELMGYSCIEEMKIIKEYDQSGDCLLLGGEGSFFRVSPGFFAVFSPQDVHMPCIATNAPETVKKVVVKVAVSVDEFTI